MLAEGLIAAQIPTCSQDAWRKSPAQILLVEPSRNVSFPPVSQLPLSAHCSRRMGISSLQAKSGAGAGSFLNSFLNLGRLRNSA